jgi:hypothetical protein
VAWLLDGRPVEQLRSDRYVASGHTPIVHLKGRFCQEDVVVLEVSSDVQAALVGHD